jgi:hypothetical protein
MGAETADCTCCEGAKAPDANVPDANVPGAKAPDAKAPDTMGTVGRFIGTGLVAADIKVKERDALRAPAIRTGVEISAGAAAAPWAVLPVCA